MDDISWGTKGNVSLSNNRNKYFDDKIIFISGWLKHNALLTLLLLLLDRVW